MSIWLGNQRLDGIDENAVHKTGDETIAGAKTFTGTVLCPTPATNSNDTTAATTAWVGTHRIIAFQAPTSANGYTWYRKYADGWVEQGGYVARGTAGSTTITFPVALTEAPKVASQMMYNITDTSGVTWVSNSFNSVTATRLSIYRHSTIDKSWTVAGMAA